MATIRVALHEDVLDISHPDIAGLIIGEEGDLLILDSSNAVSAAFSRGQWVYAAKVEDDD